MLYRGNRLGEKEMKSKTQEDIYPQNQEKTTKKERERERGIESTYQR